MTFEVYSENTNFDDLKLQQNVRIVQNSCRKNFKY